MTKVVNNSLPTLHGPFDIIFIDADKENYIEYFDMIMERKLLAPDGIILADNGTLLLSSLIQSFQMDAQSTPPPETLKKQPFETAPNSVNSTTELQRYLPL